MYAGHFRAGALKIDAVCPCLVQLQRGCLVSQVLGDVVQSNSLDVVIEEEKSLVSITFSLDSYA